LDFYENLKRGLAQASIPELLYTLNEVCLIFGRCCIIVDALDEYKPDYRKTILQILKDLDLAVVQLFIPSRLYAHDIKRKFYYVEQVHIKANEINVKTYFYRIMDDNETTCELVKGALRAEITNINIRE
jgi:hypothetical protein